MYRNIQNKMRCANKLAAIVLSAFMWPCFLNTLFAQSFVPFTGEITADGINIRTDSTVSSEVICNIDEGRQVEVVYELYDWYKIKLPKDAPSFIKKSFVSVIEDRPADSFDKLKDSNAQRNNIAKVSADKVNIRLSPDESSAIVGRAGKNEVITVLQDKGDWLKIEPISNSFGWINKRFVRKAPVVKKAVEENKQEAKPVPSDALTVEGVIKPYGMIIKRTATHKLLTADNNIFLLKGNKKNLDALNYHKVKVSGKLINSPKDKFPVVEIEKIEGLD